MTVTRNEKQDIVQELVEALQKAQAVIITDYRGIPTADLNGLRNQLRGSKTHYQVAKNTLVALALKEAGLPVPADLLEGPTGLAFLNDELAGPAKMIGDFFKDKNPIKGAIVGKSITDAQGVQALAQMPSRDQLYSLFLGALQGPPASLVGVLNGALSELVRTLDAKAQA